MYVLKHSFLNFNLFCQLDWITDPRKLTIIAFSFQSEFEVRLPHGKLNLIVHIRDLLDCIAEFNLSSIDVLSDTKTNLNLINQINDNPLIQLLFTANQNTIGQVITSISQEINQMNNESLVKAVSSKINSFIYFIFLLFYRWNSSYDYFCITIRISIVTKSNFI